MTPNELADQIASFTHDPEGFVDFAYDWNHGELAGVLGPRKWQRTILRYIGEQLRDPTTRHQPIQIGVASGHGIGKALDVNTILPSPAGPKRMGDLLPGDQVYGSNGKPTRVADVRFQGVRPTYRVTFDDGSFVLADENHNWAVRGRQERRKKLPGYRTMTTLEILNAGVKRSNGVSLAKQWEIPTQAAVEGSLRYPHGYTLGVWIGDGSSNRAGYTKPDLEVEAHIRSTGIETKRSNGDAVAIDFRSELKRLGLFECRSYERFIPEECFEWLVDDRAELLRGLLDTDGECASHGSVLYASSSERLAKDIIRLARSLGGKAHAPKLKEAYIGDVRHRDSFRVTIRMPSGFSPFYIKRKAERVLESVEHRYLVRWLDKIERVEDHETVCITVEADDSLFLANDYIVTHNSAEIGILINWAMSTCEDCKIVYTANTHTQLRTKTTPEIHKWFKLSLTHNWFDLQSESIKSVDKEHGKSWIANAVTWSLTNTEAFAGLHNKKKRIVVVFDEASAIEDKVWEVTEGALTDEETEIIWIAFGNPTRNSGRFKDIFGKLKHRWKTWRIDSRDVEGTNKAQLAKWEADYGVDSDFFKVRVRGIHPNTSLKQFISAEDVDHAFGLHLRPEQYNFAPKIISVDPAWEGDDELVIAMRQGLSFKILATIPKNDNDVAIANMVGRFEDDEKADAVFIDAGYGTGIVSVGKTLGRNWQLVWFAGAPMDKGYLNKRAEMWGQAKKWLREGGAIPKDQVLYDDLIGPETVPRVDGKIQLESKQDMKARGLPSPNRADALIISFAFPVASKLTSLRSNPGRLHKSDWNPMQDT